MPGRPPLVVAASGWKDGVARARTWLRTWLDTFGVPPAAAADAVLVLSELATNAAVHSRSSGPHGSYLVRLRRGVTRLRLEVVDAGGRTEPRAQRTHPSDRDPLRVAGPGAVGSGYGLALVEAFSLCWWTRGDERGRTVGAEIALAGDGPRPMADEGARSPLCR
jgi:serine/threonine-protein kinase RsbW